MTRVGGILRNTVMRRYAVIAACVLAHAQAASAAPLEPTTPASFAQALQRVVNNAEVRAGSTTPMSPLVTAGNRLESLAIDTTHVVGAVVDLVSAAQHELLLQIYEWEDPDESAQRVLAALEARVARALQEGEQGPLSVRLLLDDSWPALSAKHRDQVFAFVRNVGAQPLAAHSVHVELASFHGFAWGILHSKTVVQDGARALVFTGNFKTAGGMAQDFYNMGAVVAGPMVQAIRADWLSARHLSRRDVAAGPEPESLPAVTAAATAPTPGNVFGAVLSRRANARWSDSTPNPQNQGLLAMLGTARGHVEVLNPAMNVPAIITAVVDAVVGRQVTMDVVLSLNMDRQFQRTFGGADNAETAYKLYNAILRAAGPSVADRLRIFWASSDGATIAPPSDPGNVHAKTMAFDDSCLWVGSMNWDKQSWNNSRELSVVLCGDGLVNDWRQAIFASRLKQAVPMHAVDLPRRARWAGDPVYQYLKEREQNREIAAPAR